MTGVHLGGGWKLWHLTDRSIELRKDDATYRKVLGRDGYVRLRAEPGMDRRALIEKAKERAQADDARLAEIVAKQLTPLHLFGFRMRQRTMANLAFATPEDPEIIGRKGA